MKRKLMDELAAWKRKADRMPLVLNGARQVGKTYLLKEFGRECYGNVVHVNLETNLLINSLFADDISPRRLVELLEVHTGERILPEKTLVVLDEIQSCERALLALKVFCEEAPQYHVAAAGSLLGVALHRERYSFPVGKVDELSLFPLDFEEFLWALGEEALAAEIRRRYLSNEAMPEVLHERAMELYKKYLVVGGMPAVVNGYVESGSMMDVGNAQGRILSDYVADMSKYANAATSVKVRACYNSIPAQLAKDNRKFQYKVVQRGGSATIFGESIEWLNFAGIALKCQKVNGGHIPLAVNVDLADFKLYLSDVGMLTMKSGMPPSMILSKVNEDNTFMGALTENYVAQAFAANGLPLYYWRSENTAEVDFVLQLGAEVVPVEVKAGVDVRSKSLGIFMERYKCGRAIRISRRNFGEANGVKSVPLYAVFCVGEGER